MSQRSPYSVPQFVLKRYELPWLPELACLAVAVIWGATFIATQLTVNKMGVFGLLGLRFGIGALALIMSFMGRMRGFTRTEIWAGTVLGVTLFAGFALLSFGLRYMSSSKAAFITAVYVPLVPIFQLMLLKKSPSTLAWIGVAFACVGLIFLSGGNYTASTSHRGELLILGCAVASALEIVLLSRLIHTGDTIRLAVVQLLVASMLGWLIMPAVGERAPILTVKLVFLILALGLSIAAVRAAMFWAQRTVSATRATLLYATEPIWASVIGVLAGERMTLLAVIGCCCILFGVVIGELRRVPKWLTFRTVDADVYEL